MFERRRQRKAAEALATAQHELHKLDELLEEARTFRGESSADLPPTPIVLKADERYFGVFVGATLIEPRSAGGHWEGRSQGFSIPVGGTRVRYRVGASKGHYVKTPEQPTIIDRGTAVITDRRVVFAGPKHTREWLWAKTVAITHSDTATMTVISVTNRQKASGIGYDDQHATLVRFRLDLANAVANGTTDRLIAELERDRAEAAGHIPSLLPPAPAAPPPPPPPHALES